MRTGETPVLLGTRNSELGTMDRDGAWASASHAAASPPAAARAAQAVSRLVHIEAPADAVDVLAVDIDPAPPSKTREWWFDPDDHSLALPPLGYSWLVNLWPVVNSAFFATTQEYKLFVELLDGAEAVLSRMTLRYVGNWDECSERDVTIEYMGDVAAAARMVPTFNGIRITVNPEADMEAPYGTVTIIPIRAPWIVPGTLA